MSVSLAVVTSPPYPSVNVGSITIGNTAVSIQVLGTRTRMNKLDGPPSRMTSNSQATVCGISLESCAIGASAYHNVSVLAVLRTSILLVVCIRCLYVFSHFTPSSHRSTPVEVDNVHSASKWIVPVIEGAGRLTALSMVICFISRLGCAMYSKCRPVP